MKRLKLPMQSRDKRQAEEPLYTVPNVDLVKGNSCYHVCSTPGPVVRKPINANPRFISLSQTLFNADNLQNVRLEESNPEKTKSSKRNFQPKVKKLKPKFTLIQDYVNRLSNNRARLDPQNLPKQCLASQTALYISV